MKKAKGKSKKAKMIFAFFVSLYLCIFAVNFSAQSGGQFSITQSVVANGGADSNGGNFGITGTIGQTNAGDNSGGEPFAVKGGFWQAFLAPTAAQVSVSGQVLAANGAGIRNARVTMINQSGQTQIALTGSFGYFRFEEVPVGETYILSVQSKRFTFSNGTMVVTVLDNIDDIVFVAD